jgi:hypothetical protein
MTEPYCDEAIVNGTSVIENTTPMTPIVVSAIVVSALRASAMLMEKKGYELFCRSEAGSS